RHSSRTRRAPRAVVPKGVPMADDVTPDPDESLIERIEDVIDEARKPHPDAYDKVQDVEIAQLQAEVAALQPPHQAEGPAPPAPTPPPPPAPPVPPTPSPTPTPTPTPAPPAPPAGLTVAFVNESTLVTDAEVAGWANAFEAMSADIDSHWHTGRGIVLGPMA